jgi:hypothetical protein
MRMSKVRLITIGLMVATLAACSSGPSESKAEEAMLAFVKANGSEDAKLTKFSLGKCSKSDNGGYNCPVESHVVAMGGNFDQDFKGVFTFAEVDGKYKIVGTVSRTL